jgi:rod shape-determining protein MreC
MFSKKVVLIAVLLLCLTVSILVLALISRRPSLASAPSRVAISIVAPFQKMITHTTHLGRETWEYYFSLIEVAKENKRLRNDLNSALAANNQCQEILLANTRLKELLGLKERMKPPPIAGRVISKDPSPWFQSILIDKGSADGVNKGSPVINPQGIVGLVIDTTAHYAKVMLITDPNSAVDAVIQKSRARGIIKGGASGHCTLNYVLRKHGANAGDMVIASGMDNVFPKGLPLGRILELSQDDADIFQNITVTPFVDFERLEEVLIVPSSENREPA